MYIYIYIHIIIIINIIMHIVINNTLDIISMLYQYLCNHIQLVKSEALRRRTRHAAAHDEGRGLPGGGD